MRNKDSIEDTTYADVVEDEQNEWITGVVPLKVVPIEDEQDDIQAEGSTSQKKRVPRKKMLPVFGNDDGVQSGGSSSEDEDEANDSD